MCSKYKSIKKSLESIYHPPANVSQMSKLVEIFDTKTSFFCFDLATTRRIKRGHKGFLRKILSNLPGKQVIGPLRYSKYIDHFYFLRPLSQSSNQKCILRPQNINTLICIKRNNFIVLYEA